MRMWRNWQTRRSQTPVDIASLWVQVPSSAPNIEFTLFCVNSIFFVIVRGDLNPLKHLIRQCLCVATFPSRVRHKITPQVFGLWGLFYLFFCCSYFFCCFYWNFGDCFKFFLFLTLFIFCYESVAGCDKTRKNEQYKKNCRKCAY